MGLCKGREGPAGNYYDGGIDEVRIWNRALAAGELGRRFNSPQTDLVGWWGFNEGTGDTFADLSGNGNPGRLGSLVGPDGNDPQWILATLPTLP